MPERVTGYVFAGRKNRKNREGVGMDIKNGKMSGRQAGYMFFYSFLALPVLLLPQQLTRMSGMDGFFALVIGSLSGYLFLRIVLLLISHMECSYSELLQRYLGRGATCLVELLYLLIALFTAAYGLQLLCQVVRMYLIRDTPAWLVMGAVTILILYGLGTDTECRGRRCELLFWFVVVPLLLMVLLAVWNIESDHWLPVAQISGQQLLDSSYVVFSYTMVIACLPIYADVISQREQLCKHLKRSYLCSMILQMILFLTLTGIYGVPTVAVMDDTLMELAAMVKVPGGFLERQDAWMCGIWFVGMYVFVETAWHAVTWSMEHIGGRQQRHWSLIGSGVLVYLVALLLYRYRNWNLVLGHIYLAAAVPALVLILTVLTVVVVWRTHRKVEKK